MSQGQKHSSYCPHCNRKFTWFGENAGTLENPDVNLHIKTAHIGLKNLSDL